MNIIDKRDMRTIRRKIAKQEYDELIKLGIKEKPKKLSVSGSSYRLLDEGAVVFADGYIDFYIQKGTLSKYMEMLPDDYVGSVNLGHLPFATYPILLGYWTKEDLTLVDIGDGRQGLDVTPHFYEDVSVVKDLRAMDYTLCLSAEFGYSLNDEATREYGIDIIDELFITDFAVVGEAGNVGSSDIMLKVEEDDMKIDELAKKLSAEKEKKLTLSDVSALLDAEIEGEKELEATEEVAEEATEEVAEETTEEVAEEAEEAAEEAEETTEEVAEESHDFKELFAAVSQVMERNKELEAQVSELQAKLSAREAQETEFVKKLFASVSTERTETPETNDKPVYTDGIGE